MADSPWQRLIPLMDLATPWALRTVATLGVADHVAEGVDRLPELAAVCGIPSDRLGRLLRFLVARGLFTEPTSERFVLTPLGELLRAGAGVREWLDQEGFGGAMDRAWPELLPALRSGKTPYEIAVGRPLWEDLEARPALGASFNELMATQSESLWQDLLKAYDWSSVHQVIDVGGGTGTLAAALARAVPTLRAVVLDLPKTAHAANEYFAREGLAERCQAVPGNMFEPLPQGADLYLLSIVLGDWDDEHALAILLRCADAAGARGRVVVVEAVLDEDAAAHTAMDFAMLLVGHGRARTIEEYRELLARAGLPRIELRTTPLGRCLFVAEAERRGN